MKIQFIGGARTVTGSQHLLSINGKNTLLECGLFQGRRQDTYEKNKNFKFDPKEIDALILSHAHIDHSGNIPNLVKNGFDGPIYATAATVDLCEIMLKDSAYLQERDVEWLNKKRRNKNQEPAEALYSLEDVERALTNFVAIEYNTATEIFPGTNAIFQDAGHILGSASILLEIEEEMERKFVSVFQVILEDLKCR